MAVCSRRVVRVCSVCTVITVTLQPSHHTTTTLPVHYQSLSNHRDLSSSDNKWSPYTKHPLKVRLDPLKCIPLVSSQFWVSAALLYPHTSPGTLLMTRSHVNIHIKPPARDLHMIDCSLLLLSFLEARMTAWESHVLVKVISMRGAWWSSPLLSSTFSSTEIRTLH